MDNWITEFIGEHGYFGVLLLLLIENLFPPIPSEIILTFSGYATGFTTMTRTGVIIAATIGAVVGAMILYCVGLLVDVARLEKFVDRWGRWLRLRGRIYGGLKNGLKNTVRGQCFFAASFRSYVVLFQFRLEWPT